MEKVATMALRSNNGRTKIGQNIMNKETLIGLFETGAYFVVGEYRIYHPSFRKGWRKLTPGNISLSAAQRALGSRLQLVDGVYKIA